MDQQKVDMYLIANQKYFPPEKTAYLRERLLAAPDDRLVLLSTADLKDPTTLLLISIFLGYLGIDHFMLGDIGMGVLKLLTGGCCGILTIIDWFTVSGKTKELNLNNVLLLL